MKIQRVIEVECEDCGKHLRTIYVDLKDVEKELQKNHLCRQCDEILEINVRRMSS